MKLPDPIRVKIDVNLNFSEHAKKEIDESVEKTETFDLYEITLDDFRSVLHEVLIDKLKELYKSENWLKQFDNNARKFHGYNVQSHLLKKFEKGENTTENFLLLVLKELYLQNKKLILKFTEDGSLNIE